MLEDARSIASVKGTILLREPIGATTFINQVVAFGPVNQPYSLAEGTASTGRDAYRNPA